MERVRRRPLGAYVAVVVLVAAVGLYDDARASRGHAPFGGSPVLVALLVAAAVVASIWTIQRRGRSGTGEVTGTWAFLGAVLFLVPPVTAAAAAGAVATLAAVARRKEPIAIWFNAAALVVSVSVAETVLHLDPGRDRVPWPMHPGIGWFTLVFGALLAAFVTNVVVISVGIGIDSRLPLREVATAQFSEAVLLELTLVSLAPILVVAGRWTLFSLPPLLGAIAVVIHTGSQSLRRRHDATHDALTGLANRRLFDQRLQDALRSVETGGDVGVLLVDLDGFKSINDSYGHDQGDRVLIEVAQRMAAVCRHADLVARIGGDEFALLLPGASPAAAGEILRRLQHAIAPPIDLGGGSLVTVGASVGIATAPADGVDAGQLLRSADEAMYDAKLRVDPEPTTSGSSPSSRGGWGELTRALGAGELLVEYQPVVSVGDSRPVGVEALVRWQHPEAGVLAPAAFLPAVERADAMGLVTEWVLREAVRQGAEWEAAGHRLRVAVNVSPRDLADRRFPGLVQRVLANSGLDASRLVLEVADGSVLFDDRTRPGLVRLRELGVGMAIDDLGPGTPTVGHLRHLPVRQVKFDRRLVSSLGHDRRDERVFRALVELADALGLDTVAVGVEDDRAVELLRRTMCVEAQGFVIAPPMSAGALGSWIGMRSGEPGTAVAPDLVALRGPGGH